MTKFKNAFVVTGSIASGKSSFVNLLISRGFSVIDADKISHDQLEKCADEVISEFGTEILKDNQEILAQNLDKNLYKIDRKKLGKIVFNDPKKLKWLENLLHPKIRREINERCEINELKNRAYFVDIPLFYEKFSYDFKNVIVVYAPQNLLISRVMKRDNLSLNEAKARVNLQINIEKKREMADFVIDNSGDLANLERELESFLAKISKRGFNVS